MKTPIRRLVTVVATGTLLGLGCGPEQFYSRVSSGTGGAFANIQSPPASGGRGEVGGAPGVAATGGAPAGGGSGGAAGARGEGSSATGGAPELSGTGGGSGGDVPAAEGGTSDGTAGAGVTTGPLVISVDFVST